MADMEKLTINVNPVDLGQIELLVEQGFYANRTEFIRVAIHDGLGKHAEIVRDASVRQAFVVGALFYDREALEKARAENRRLAIRVVGLLHLADDVTPELASETIESVKVRGILKAPRAVKESLAGRIF